MGILNKIAGFFINIYIFSWDNLLFVCNLLTPSIKPGHIVPHGTPGHGGNWPEFVPPKDGDSRSCCPALNALANHGILPHDGKNISFKELNEKVRQSYNFAPTFCFFVPKYAADFLNRSYWSGTFNLDELSLHNAIEHDASLTRRDAALEPDQSKPDQQLVADLLAEATGSQADGSAKLTIPDLSRALSKRFVDAKKTNKQYSESLIHNVFGASKFVVSSFSTTLLTVTSSSTMLTIFGGSIADLTPILAEERIPADWEPRVRSRFGLTMAKFQLTVLPVLFGVNRKKIEQAEAAGTMKVDGGPAPAAAADSAA
jgi:hypothetical protein